MTPQEMVRWEAEGRAWRRMMVRTFVPVAALLAVVLGRALLANASATLLLLALFVLLGAGLFALRRWGQEDAAQGITLAEWEAGAPIPTRPDRRAEHTQAHRPAPTAAGD